MKIILKIFVIIWICLNLFLSYNNVYATWELDYSLDNASYIYNVQTWTPRNYYLNKFWKTETWAVISEFFGYRITGGQWIFYTLVQIAHSLKNLLFYLATLFYIIIALKLIFAENTEEQVNKFKKWIIWITIWLIVMQVAYIYTLTLYAKRVSELLAFDIIDNIFNPLIGLLEVLASFFFLAIAIFTFFRLVTAHWNEEEIKRAKMTIVYAIMWFILLKLAKVIVNWVYWTLECKVETVAWLDVITTSCLWEKTSWNLSEMFLTIINWVNWFVWIITVILIIYVWFKLLFSRWEEEVIKKSKTAIIYIIIWIVLLAMNYLILTFFLRPEAII